MNWMQALRRARVSSRAWSNEFQKYVSILQYGAQDVKSCIILLSKKDDRKIVVLLITKIFK